MIDQTGVGDEGNGGVASGQVQSKYVKGAYHAIHLEKPAKVAEEIKSMAEERAGKLARGDEEERAAAVF